MSRDALAVRDLHVSFPGDDAPVPALRGVDLRIAPGRALGLVGPTGSGKSALGLAVIGLLPARTRVTGSVVVGGTELLGLDDNAMSRHRGRDDRTPRRARRSARGQQRAAAQPRGLYGGPEGGHRAGRGGANGT